MERIRRHKAWVVWLLLAVFTLPFAVKTVHRSRTAGDPEHSCSGESHSHHDYSDCPVCRFILSPFIETGVVESGFRVILFNFEPAVSIQPGSRQQVPLSCGLRGPPPAEGKDILSGRTDCRFVRYSFLFTVIRIKLCVSDLFRLCCCLCPLCLQMHRNPIP
jgi:hypothetical protein